MNNITIIQRDDYEKKDGTRALYLQVYINGRRVLMPVDISVREDQWDKINHQVNATHSKARDYNMVLTKKIALANDIMVKYRLMDQDLTALNFRSEFRNPTSRIDFYEWMDKEISCQAPDLSPGTVKQLKVTLGKLKEFRPCLNFAEIDKTFVERWERHMRTVNKNGMGTIGSNLKRFRKFVNLALERRLMNKDPFTGIKIKQNHPMKVSLDNAELKLMQAHYAKLIPGSTAWCVLRHFLFMCVTGLRISDLTKLDHDHFTGGFIVMMMHKTKNINAKMIKVPLGDYARKLIHDEAPLRVHGKVFDLISEQKMRDHIKAIATELKINKNVSLHTGRHTFATLYLKATHDIAGLKKMMGHSSLDQTMEYIDVSAQDVTDGMMKFEEILSPKAKPTRKKLNIPAVGN